MAVYNKIQQKQMFVGKLDYDGDLLDQLTAICQKENISLGKVQAIGAVQKAKVGYYNQKTREYQLIEIDRNLEITNLCGNISLRDNKPMVHAHITLADKDGNAFGGHLVQGTIVFACEFIIHILAGPAYHRAHDENTGLPLWNI